MCEVSNLIFQFINSFSLFQFILSFLFKWDLFMLVVVLELS